MLVVGGFCLFAGSSNLLARLLASVHKASEGCGFGWRCAARAREKERKLQSGESWLAGWLVADDLN